VLGVGQQGGGVVVWRFACWCLADWFKKVGFG